jgi:hypothetical protein
MRAGYARPWLPGASGREAAEKIYSAHAPEEQLKAFTRIIRDAALVRVRERHSSYWVGRVV